MGAVTAANNKQRDGRDNKNKHKTPEESKFRGEGNMTKSSTQGNSHNGEKGGNKEVKTKIYKTEMDTENMVHINIVSSRCLKLNKVKKQHNYDLIKTLFYLAIIHQPTHNNIDSKWGH